MIRYGVERELYYCPQKRSRVLLTLYYGIFKGETMYSAVDCANKFECGCVDGKVVSESCPAYKLYITEGGKH